VQLPLFPISPEIHRLQIERLKLQGARLAPNTISGYRYDWAMFLAWCARMDRPWLPASPETVALYLTGLLDQGKKISTARRRCCAIVHYHRRESLASPITPEIYELLTCAQRQRGEQPRQMRPISVAELREISILLAADDTPVSLRNRAILVVGFASALRRSNIAALELADVEFAPEGVIIAVHREKQDQEGRGRLIGLPRGQHPETCPVRCLWDWLARRGGHPGPLFPRLDRARAGAAMDGECVCRVVKRCVARIGLDPRDRWGAHSLRAGFITAAGENGAGEFLIAAQTGHRSMAVLRRYFRRSQLFRSNACAAVGL